MDEFTWLIKMLPEGVSVTAVLSVVVLFLKAGSNLLERHETQLGKMQEEHKETISTMQSEHKETIKALTDAHNTVQKETREGFSSQLKEIATTFNDRHESMQDKVNSLTEAHIKVSGDTVSALNGLRDAVRELQTKVK